ncbi:MAG: hypothetical protein WC712_06895 [Candidatus Brocadiia bacterium]
MRAPADRAGLREVPVDPSQDGSGSFAEVIEEGFLGGKGKGGLASIDECGLMIDDWEGAKRWSFTTEVTEVHRGRTQYPPEG